MHYDAVARDYISVTIVKAAIGYLHLFHIIAVIEDTIL